VTWFAFSGYPTIDLAGSQEKEAVVLGWHGYATQAQAEASPNSVNIFQKPFLDLVEADYAAAVRAGEQPGGKNATPTPGNVAAGDEQLAESFTPFASVAQGLTAFYRVLTNGKMWRSLGWLLLGLALMIAGAALLLKGRITTEVGQIAKAAA
jgi:hypothetical protein